MTRHRLWRRARLLRIVETLLCGFFVLLAYVALGYAVAMNAFFNAPDTWLTIMAVLSFALQIVVILYLKGIERGRR